MPNYCRFCGYPSEEPTCPTCDLRFRRASGHAILRCPSCKSEVAHGSRVCPTCGLSARGWAMRLVTMAAAMVTGGGLAGLVWLFFRRYFPLP